jgi:predicted outer membrane repeat protein
MRPAVALARRSQTTARAVTRSAERDGAHHPLRLSRVSAASFHSVQLRSICTFHSPSRCTSRRTGPHVDIRTLPPDGSTWGSAYPTPAAALAVAVAGDELWVAAGSYPGSLTLSSGVALYGGFMGTENVRAERPAFPRSSPDPFATTLVGTGNSVVTIPDDAAAGTVLDGCAVTGGSAPDGDGAGVRIGVRAAPTVRFCTIQSCFASNRGGGVFCASNSAPAIVDNVLTGNRALLGGGIACARDCTATISGNTVSQNQATQKGGGIQCQDCSPTLTGNTIDRNTASIVGGGIACQGASPDIGDCLLDANQAPNGAGLACESGSRPTVADCRICNNQATQNGGGLYCVTGSDATFARNPAIATNRAARGAGAYFSGCSPSLSRSLVAENTAILAGGGLYAQQTGAQVLHTAFVGNRVTAGPASIGGGLYATNCTATLLLGNIVVAGNAANRGGGIACVGAAPRLHSSSIAGNRTNGVYIVACSPEIANTIVASNITGIVLSGSGTPALAANCVHEPSVADRYVGLAAGAADIQSDPRFTDVYLHVATNSPCVDAGDTSYVGDLAEDMDGQGRVLPPWAVRLDIGADEVPYGTVPTPAIVPPGGTFNDAVSVMIERVANATVRYTTDGTDPDPSDPSVPDGYAIGFSVDTTLRARAWLDPYAPSAVTQAVYTILNVALPTFTPEPGWYPTNIAMAISCATPGATIRYTTDGRDPTTNDTVIASGDTILLSSNTVVKAKAWKEGLISSHVKEGWYRIRTLFVRRTNPPGEDGDGTSWDQAFQSINAAIAAAETNSEIWVATCWEVYQQVPKSYRELVLVDKHGLRFYGSFQTATERMLSERPPLDPETMTWIYPEQVKYAEEPAVRLFHEGVPLSWTVIDGFGISGGFGRGQYREGFGNVSGGGISVGPYVWADIHACIIKQNGWEVLDDNTVIYTGCGGGIFSAGGGKLRVTDCLFENNHAATGGAIGVHFGNYFIARNRIKGNSAEQGGGIFTYYDEDMDDERIPVPSYIIDNIIEDNRAPIRDGAGYPPGRGGGIYVGNLSHPAIYRNQIVNNSADKLDGGIYVGFQMASADICDNLILTNGLRVPGECYGAGICVEGESGARILRNRIVSNAGPGPGGGGGGIAIIFGSVNVRVYGNWLYKNSFSGPASLGGGMLVRNIVKGLGVPRDVVTINNTFVKNVVDGSGGGFYSNADLEQLRFSNNLLVQNQPHGVHIDAQVLIDPILRANDVWGNSPTNWAGIPDPTGTDGNLCVAPAFWADSLHQLPDSPTVDAGDDGEYFYSRDQDKYWEWVVTDRLTNLVWREEHRRRHVDLDIQPRLMLPHIDIGADEFAQVAPPCFYPNGAHFRSPTNVYVLCVGDENAGDQERLSGDDIPAQNPTARYTLDGSTPDEGDAGFLSPGQVEVTRSGTLKARAWWGDWWWPSDTASADFRIGDGLFLIVK